MGLFDKKFCDICGEKIGLLGNRKLEDGNMCKNCAKKLSPWFDERRHSTIEEIKKQLEYREKNKDEVRAFNVTRECGNDHYKVYFDDTQQKFIISSSRDFRAANPDVISYSQILNCYVEEQETREEEYRETADGEHVSYNPPRYEYKYSFVVHLYVNSPYFDEIDFAVHSGYVERHGMMNRYAEYQSTANMIVNNLLNAQMMARGGQMGGAAAGMGGQMGGQFAGNTGMAGNAGMGSQFAGAAGMAAGAAGIAAGAAGMAAGAAGMAAGQQQTQAPAGENWFCGSCGTANQGSFCSGCGAPKPAARSFRCDKCGWEPDDPANPPKFCPACGDPFDSNDIK